ncbi:MAG: hypothetical protein IJZ95_02505 [Oscillospiraceae bacterium]|nr:hypothetical protein [Oscillospiraceae bacterium]
MAFQRLHRLVKNSAFTLAETLCAFAVLAAAAVMLLTSVGVAANLSAAAEELRRSSDDAADCLLRKQAHATTVFPVVTDHNGTVTEGMEITLYVCGVTEDMHFCYYDGETGGDAS